jgi:hypothetical protein
MDRQGISQSRRTGSQETLLHGIDVQRLLSVEDQFELPVASLDRGFFRSSWLHIRPSQLNLDQDLDVATHHDVPHS